MVKAKINKKVVKTNELSSLLRRRELVVGLASLAIIVVMVTAVGLKRVNSAPKAPIKDTSSTFITPSPMATAKPTAVKEVPPVKKLSNTSSDEYVVIINGDSYWKITKRFCGSGKNYKYIKDYNNSKPLYKGDFVKVYCF